MHVAYIHQHFTTRSGAGGTRSYEFGQCLLRAGHRVTVITGAATGSGLSADPTGEVAEQDVDGIRVLCLPVQYSNKMGFINRVRSFGRFARDAAGIGGKLDADVVFATSTPLTVGLPGMKIARKLNVPFVFEVRDLWPEVPIAMGVVKNPLLAWYLKRMERRIYRAASRIIALSPGIKEGICRSGYPADRVAMVPNSADTTLFRPGDNKDLDAQFGPPGEFRLVFTGAHGLANGLDAVLDAVLELKRRGVQGIRFVFIGRGSQRDRLIQRSRDEGTADMISWIEPVPRSELATILPRMDVGMMILKNLPAFYYGTSPNKFFDYISSGLPVLNNYPGWLANMIGENNCGRIAPPDDPQAFADAVLWLRDHRGELAGMGQRARNLAESQFAREQLGTQFVSVLEQACAESNS